MIDQKTLNFTSLLRFLGSSAVHLIQNILHSPVKLAFPLLGSRVYLVYTQKFPVFVSITHCQIQEAQL